MSRYIERETVLKVLENSMEYSIKEFEEGEFRKGCIAAIKDDISNISHLPTADVVEVVRCKDCKHWVKGGYDPIISRKFGSCTCEYWEHPTEYFETADTDYCSYGERKDGNDT